MKRVLAVALLALPLQGCFFLYVPGSLIDKVSDSIGGYEGNLCVGRSAQVGSKIRMPDGQTGTVRKIEGESGRCNTNATQPIRAVVVADPSAI